MHLGLALGLLPAVLELLSAHIIFKPACACCCNFLKQFFEHVQDAEARKSTTIWRSHNCSFCVVACAICLCLHSGTLHFLFAFVIYGFVICFFIILTK